MQGFSGPGAVGDELAAAVPGSVEGTAACAGALSDPRVPGAGAARPVVRGRYAPSDERAGAAED